MQVFFSGQLTDDEILANLERAASQLRALLTRYEEVPDRTKQYADRLVPSREEYCWRLTLEYGIGWAWAQLGWIESVIERIEGGELPVA